MMNNKIAYKLKELRLKKGMTQEGLAEKIGVSRQTVSNWESAATEPDIDNLLALSKLYGVKVDDLIIPADKQEEFEAKREAFFGMEDEQKTAKTPKSRAASFPFPVLVVIAYFIVGFVYNAWHPAWLLFLTIPIYYYIVGLFDNANNKDRHWLELFPYPIIVVAVFLLIGFLLGAWHPTWLLFLTIPLYYSLVKVLNNRGDGKNPLVYISYPVVVTIAFLLLGFLTNGWAWAWLLFLTIPLWYWFIKNNKDDQDNSGND